ncbi:MAG: hypothetical protein LQ338_006313, partial [Usnochroma carphineum]
LDAMDSFCSKGFTLGANRGSLSGFPTTAPDGWAWLDYDTGQGSAIHVQADWVDQSFDSVSCGDKEDYKLDGDGQCRRRLKALIDGCELATHLTVASTLTSSGDPTTRTAKLGGNMIFNSGKGCIKWSIDQTSSNGAPQELSCFPDLGHDTTHAFHPPDGLSSISDFCAKPDLVTPTKPYLADYYPYTTTNGVEIIVSMTDAQNCVVSPSFTIDSQVYNCNYLLGRAVNECTYDTRPSVEGWRQCNVGLYDVDSARGTIQKLSLFLSSTCFVVFFLHPELSI